MTTYTKLRSGAWGVRGEGAAPASGARVTVTKKSGETKAETVERVVWSGQGKWIASVAPSSAPRASNGRRSRGARYCEGWGADNPHAPRPPYTCEECGWDE